MDNYVSTGLDSLRRAAKARRRREAERSRILEIRCPDCDRKLPDVYAWEPRTRWERKCRGCGAEWWVHLVDGLYIDYVGK